MPIAYEKIMPANIARIAREIYTKMVMDTPTYISPIFDGYVEATGLNATYPSSTWVHRAFTQYVQGVDSKKVYYHPINPSFRIKGSDIDKMIHGIMVYGKISLKRNDSRYVTMAMVGETVIITPIIDKNQAIRNISKDLYIVCNSSKQAMIVNKDAFADTETIEDAHKKIFDKIEVIRGYNKHYMYLAKLDEMESMLL